MAYSFLEWARNNVTRAIAVSERKKSFRKFDFSSFAVWTNAKKSDHETKAIARQVINIKFSLAHKTR